MWTTADLADALQAGLAACARRLADEQAVYGLDALEELQLHPILAEALRSAGFGVFREQRYPADRRKQKESEGERCDFVLTPDGRELAAPDREDTLFDPPDVVPLDEALWLEVKVVCQYTIEGPNARYGSQLLSTVRQDVTKLSKDPGILRAAVLIVLFVADERVARHDLGIWQDRCLARGLPIAAPSVRDVPIADRMGHAVCTLALYPVSHL